MENKISVFKNAVVARIKNRRIHLIAKENGIHIQMVFADNNANEPAVFHNSVKDKLRVSDVYISHESMIALCESYKIFLKENIKYEKPKTK